MSSLRTNHAFKGEWHLFKLFLNDVCCIYLIFKKYLHSILMFLNSSHWNWETVFFFFFLNLCNQECIYSFFAGASLLFLKLWYSIRLKWRDCKERNHFANTHAFFFSLVAFFFYPLRFHFIEYKDVVYYISHSICKQMFQYISVLLDSEFLEAMGHCSERTNISMD